MVNPDKWYQQNKFSPDRETHNLPYTTNNHSHKLSTFRHHMSCKQEDSLSLLFNVNSVEMSYFHKLSQQNRFQLDKTTHRSDETKDRDNCRLGIHQHYIWHNVEDNLSQNFSRKNSTHITHLDNLFQQNIFSLDRQTHIACQTGDNYPHMLSICQNCKSYSFLDKKL